MILLLSGQHAAAQPWSTGGPVPELQQGFDVHYYDINLKVNGDDQFISGHTVVHIYAKKDNLRDFKLDLVHVYSVEKVQMNGQDLNFTHQGDYVYIALDQVLMKGEKAAVDVRYSGNPPVAQRPPWEGGFNWSKDPDGNHWIGVSCQLEGAKIWFPSKDHPVSRADSVAVNITVPRPYKVVSNGLLESVEEAADDHQTWRWITRYPIHNYNVSINIARFELVEHTYKTRSGKEMPVVFYVLPQYKDQADQLLEITIDKLKQLRAYFGEYGFTSEKFGLVHTDYLGMEHQTINSYGNDFEYTVIDGRPYDWLLLHEMGHEWWGNLITVTDWADFWIHEGITTYTDALFLWDYYSEDVYHEKLKDYIPNIRHHQPIIPGEQVTSAEVYNHDVYYKGAYFMHTLNYVFGKHTLLNLLKGFVNKNRHGATSTREFREFLETYSGKNLEGLFHLYLYTTELPKIRTIEQSPGVYHISIPNIGFTTPMDVETTEGLHRLMLGPEPVTVHSGSDPVIDPQRWYLLDR